MNYTLEEELKVLEDIIQKHLEIDVRGKCREQVYVDARRVCYRILRDRGHRFSAIGREMGRDHATVLHGLKNWNYHLISNKLLASRYTYISSAFKSLMVEKAGRSPKIKAAVISTTLKREVDVLTRKVARLTQENSELRKSISESTKSGSRLHRITKLLEERMKEGTEEEIYYKVNRIFNGYGINT